MFSPTSVLNAALPTTVPLPLAERTASSHRRNTSSASPSTPFPQMDASDLCVAFRQPTRTREDTECEQVKELPVQTSPR